mgnify:FL=1
MKKIMSLLLVCVLALGALPLALAEGEPTEISIFVNSSVPFPADEENPVGLKIQEATNTILHVETPPSSSYAERLQITIASGEYPDLMMFPSNSDSTFLNAVEDGVILPITEYVNNSTYLKNEISDVAWSTMTIDGEIYGVPQCTVVRADGMFVRKDWLENLNLTLPEDGYLTLDELYELAYAFTFKDPDGNGKDDTYGIAMTAGSEGEMGPMLLSAFDILGWQAYEGEDYPYMNLMYSRKSDAYKQCLAFTAKLWADGLIDPNWPTLRSDDMGKERFNQGTTGIKCTAFAGQYTNYMDALALNIPTADLTYVTGVESATGNRKEAAFSTGTYMYNCLTASAKGKEQAIIDMLDWKLSPEGWANTKYGVEGVHYDVVDGVKVFNDAYDEYYKWRGNYKLVMPSNDAGYFIKPSMDPALQEKLSAWLQTAVDRVVFSLDAGFTPEASKLPEYIAYQATIKATTTKIILGELPVDAWDEALDGWYENGGEEYVKEINEFIASKQ